MIKIRQNNICCSLLFRHSLRRRGWNPYVLQRRTKPRDSLPRVAQMQRTSVPFRLFHSCQDRNDVEFSKKGFRQSSGQVQGCDCQKSQKRRSSGEPPSAAEDSRLSGGSVGRRSRKIVSTCPFARHVPYVNLPGTKTHIPEI